MGKKNSPTCVELFLYPFMRFTWEYKKEDPAFAESSYTPKRF